MTTDVRKPKGDVDEFWDEFYWEDLTAGEQALWAALGWTEKTWDDDEGEVASDEQDWADLSKSEQSALLALGYDEDSWDA